MRGFWKSFAKTFILVLKSLGPVFLIGFILLILFTTLFSYDRIKTIQERNLGSKLAGGLEVSSSCVTALIGPNEKFNFKFGFINHNANSVFLEKFGLDLNLLGDGEKSFSELLKTDPASNKHDSKGKYLFYVFTNPVEISGNSKKEILLTMQTADRLTAKASPNTIVIYDGEISFFLSPKMTDTANCKIQVRYPK